MAIFYNVTIIQKYLEIGHTQMEVDAIHSTIEKRMRNVKINHPFSKILVQSISTIVLDLAGKWETYKLQTYED